MAKLAWKVKLFEARTQAAFTSSAVAADFREVFGVQADGSDAARRAAKQWLAARGYSVRSVNVLANEDRTLVAYVAAGSLQRAAAAPAATKAGSR